MDVNREREAVSDETLVQMAREGNETAFEELFERYKRSILTFVYRFIKNRETAEEVTQEVFIYVYKNLDVFKLNKRFVTWIFLIARSLSKNALRDKKYFRNASLEEPIHIDGQEGVVKRLEDIIADPGATPDVVAQNEELAEKAQEIIDAFPEKYKEVIALYSQGITEKEVAEIVGCTPAAVSMRLRRAKVLFMKRLGVLHSGPRKGGG